MLRVRDGRPVETGKRRRVRAASISLILDTGPIVAALDRADDRHETCLSLLAEAREQRVVPAPVLVEVEYWCRRLRGDSFGAVLDDIRSGGFKMVDLLEADYARVGQLLRTYRDLRVGFVDAAVLAIVERLGEAKLATLDQRHFAVMRPAHVEALRLLPE